ncbi:MAG TPA: LysR family transcriptional regulator [Roseomonas sp.]|jgi:DNA-binding transcriptional LysR family regulator
MQGLTLRQVRAFLVTVELGSVSAAARNLGLTQPAVGQQLRELEGQLRVRLFEKVGTRLQPTPAGLALVQPARELLAAVGRLDDAAGRFRAGDSGRIRLGTGATACIHFLPAPLKQTKRALPGVEITVTTGNTPDILDALEKGALDAALVTMPPGALPASFEAELLFEDALCALLPRRLDAELPAMLGPGDLAPLPLILYEKNAATRSLIDAWFHAAAILTTPAMELGSIEAIKELVDADLGCSIIPALAAPIGHDGLVTRPLRPAMSRPLSLVLRGNTVPDAGLRLLIAELRVAGRLVAAGRV